MVTGMPDNCCHSMVSVASGSVDRAPKWNCVLLGIAKAEPADTESDTDGFFSQPLIKTSANKQIKSGIIFSIIKVRHQSCDRLERP